MTQQLQSPEIEAMLSDPHVQEVVQKALMWVQFGHQVYFKWTCGGCGERAAADKPQALHTGWRHEECGYVTKTVDGELGFILIIRSGESAEE